MRVELFGFQEEALAQLRTKALMAREHASSENPQGISFSAPTGSGKTVMLAALFEDILFGVAGFPAQPDAAILWVSDMPELNEQTRRRINQVSDRIGVHRLVTVDAGFDRELLEPGAVHFINVQKLRKDKRLTRQGDGRTWPIWATCSPLARRIERDAALNDVHLFVPYFDDAAVKAVVEDLKNVEQAPPAETGSARELVTLSRRADAAAIFEAMSDLVTYRVNAARAQSHLRRYIGLVRRLNLDEIDASDADIDRQFEEAGLRFGNGLQQACWDAHTDREALDVKVEAIVLARNHDVMGRLESQSGGPSMPSTTPTSTLRPSSRRRSAGVTSACGWPPRSPWSFNGGCRLGSSSAVPRRRRATSAICTWRRTAASGPISGVGRAVHPETTGSTSLSRTAIT